MAAITVADIARGAGVGVGTFYHYFPTKEALLLELRAQLFAETAMTLGNAFAQPMQSPDAFARALGQLIHGWIAAAVANRGLERAIVGLSFESAAIADAVHQQEEPVRQLVAALLQRYQRVLRPGDRASQAATIVVLIEAVVARAMRQPALAADPGWLVDEAVQMVTRFILPDALVEAREGGADERGGRA